MNRNSHQVIHSLPVKICLSILIIETILLTLMGFFYTRNFNREIETGVTEKMRLPAVLMSQRALNFNAVTNLEAISDLIQEEVLDAYIIKGDGTIFYTPDAAKEGKDYRNFLNQQEMALPFQASDKAEHIHFNNADGNDYISTLAPLTVDHRFLGNLYIKISANRIEQKKQDILLLFLGGSVLTIVLTTVLEAFFLYRLFVPRIARATEVLSKVEQGDFSAHVIAPEAPDQLGRLITQINCMIRTVSQHTHTLKQINAAGEQVAQVHTHRQLFEVASALLVKHFNIEQRHLYHIAQVKEAGRQPISITSDHKQLYLTLPARADHDDFLQGKFVRQDGEAITRNDDKVFLRSLNRTLNNSARRVHAIERISQAETKYRKLFSSTIDGIFRTTPQGHIEEANPALAALLGYSSPGEVIGSISDLAQQCYAIPEERNRLLYLINKQGHIIDFDLEIKRKDGTTFPASLSAQVVKDANGKIIAYEGRINNIEDRKLRERAERKREVAEAASRAQAQLVKELEINRQQLEHSLEEKEVLLREVFHRTKNNMLVIISMLHLQVQSIEDPTVRSIFMETENRIRTMSLVHEKLYRSENLSEIDLGDYLVEMVNTLVDTMVFDRQIRVVTNTRPVAISIDYAVPLGLAVNEIVTNAIVHAFPGKRQGKISLELCQNDDKVIELTIVDNGVGLPDDMNPEAPTSFGLQITRNLITKQLQGSYSLHTDHNGTTATISFTEPQRLQRVSLNHKAD